MSKILANEIANYGDNAPIDLKEGLNIPAGKPIQAAGSAGSSGQVLSTTGTSVAWVTPFDGNYNSLSNRPTIPAAQINSDWNASSGVAVILNKPVVPPLPSITTASAGTAALAYNSSNGEFTFTPPDLSSYATETYVTTRGYLTSYTETDPVFSASAASNVTTTKISNWDTSYGWGDHSSAGYLTAEADTLQSVVDRGNTCTSAVYIQDKLFFSNNFATLAELQAVSASTYHGMFAHVHGTGRAYYAHAGGWIPLLDTGSPLGDIGDVDLSVAPSDGQVLKYDATSGNWKAANDLTGGGGGGLALTDLSVSNATASGGGSLSYNNASGAFTFTPPDLTSYLTTETDPVFTASAAANVTNGQIANWNTAYAWGNHASQGYLVGYGSVANHTDVSITGASNGQLLQYNGSNWTNITPNYLTSYTETDTLDSVLGRLDSSARNLHITEGGEIRLGSTPTADYGQIWLNSNTMYIRNTLNTGAGGDIYYQSRTGHHFYSGGTAAGNNCLSLTGSGVCVLKYLGSDRLTTTAAGVTVGGTVTATSFVKSGGTASQYLMADGSVTTGGGGGGGASVSISDTPPAASTGDLWWESDTGRLKIYYQDTDSAQWVDCNPPLTQDRIASSSAPSSATDTGVPGDIRYDSSYVYICISNNTWKRASLTTW